MWVLDRTQARSLPDGLFSSNNRPGCGYLHRWPGPSGREGVRKRTSLPQSGQDPHHFPPFLSLPAPFVHMNRPLAPSLAMPSESTATGPELGKDSRWEAPGEGGGRGETETRQTQGRNLGLRTDMRLLLSRGIVPRKIPPELDFLPCWLSATGEMCHFWELEGWIHPTRVAWDSLSGVSHLLRAQSFSRENDRTFSL